MQAAIYCDYWYVCAHFSSLILCFLFTLSFTFCPVFLSFNGIEFSVSTLSPSMCSEIIHSIFIPLEHIVKFSTFRIECWDEYIYLTSNIRSYVRAFSTGIPRASVVKNPPANTGDTGMQVQSLVRKIPWRRKWQPR